MQLYGACMILSVTVHRCLQGANMVPCHVMHAHVGPVAAPVHVGPIFTRPMLTHIGSTGQHC